MRRYIDGMAELSVPLDAHPDVLGTEVTVRIAEHKGKISLPSLPDAGFPSPGEMAFLQPASLKGFRPLPETTLVANRHGMWGYISAGHAFIYIVRIRISIGGTDEVIPKQMSALGRQFDRWYSVVRDWVSAWSGQVRYRGFDYEESHIHATIKVGGKGALYGSGLTAGRVFMGEAIATREQVEAAFYCASRGYNISLQHSLLQRATSDYSNGDFRQAAINACAAAEVSLSAAVRAALSSIDVRQKTIENIMKQSTGVVEIFRLFVVAGGKCAVSDDRVIDQLARPRNQAAHAGISPSTTDVRRAIDTAKEIVEAAAPLPKPAAAKRSARKLDS